MGEEWTQSMVRNEATSSRGRSVTSWTPYQQIMHRTQSDWGDRNKLWVPGRRKRRLQLTDLKQGNRYGYPQDSKSVVTSRKIRPTWRKEGRLDMTGMKRNIRNQSPHKVETTRMTVGFVVCTRMYITNWCSPGEASAVLSQDSYILHKVSDIYHRK